MKKRIASLSANKWELKNTIQMIYIIAREEQ
jgi:hypothetical protein